MCSANKDEMKLCERQFVHKIPTKKRVKLRIHNNNSKYFFRFIHCIPGHRLNLLRSSTSRKRRAQRDENYNIPLANHGDVSSSSDESDFRCCVAFFRISQLLIFRLFAVRLLCFDITWNTASII